MKRIIFGITLLTALSAFSGNSIETYTPKNSAQKDQLVKIARESIGGKLIYAGKENRSIQNKLRTFASTKEIASLQSFTLEDDSERFITCTSRVIGKISKESLQFNSPSYDGFLAQLVEANPDAKAPLVVMGCEDHPLSTNIIGGDFAGTIMFEIDNDGNIIKALKE